MRRSYGLRESRLVHAAVGATVLAAPASAALADAPQTASGLDAHLNSHRLHYGQDIVAAGHAPASDAGQTVELNFAPSPGTNWRPIASSQIGPGGGFRLSAPLQTSGSVMVGIAAVPATGSPAAVAASGSSTTSTRPQRVAVAAGLRVSRRARSVLGSRRIVVRGSLLSRSGRHRVLLQARDHGRWITVARASTRPSGQFKLRYVADLPGQDLLRVRFPGDRSNAPAAIPAGRVTVFHQTVASWYDDAGTTACGFHAFYGVANLNLPCGTHVSFSLGGRTVNAVVDDRGPYAGGRQWDLNQNTAAALGFAGVGTVWSSE